MIIKNNLKLKFLWKKYKRKFPNKQTQFIISKIILLFNENVDKDKLTEIEIKLMNSEKNPIMFYGFFDQIDIVEKSSSISWDKLSQYLFLIYQISTFYKDTKRNIKNIYSFDNFIYLNDIKRTIFSEWSFSIINNFENSNFYIKKVLEWLL